MSRHRWLKIDWSGPLTAGPPSLLHQANRILRQVYRPALERALTQESYLMRRHLEHIDAHLAYKRRLRDG